jgi:hypothetical protein
MKLYTLSTFECQGYTTANWFFATSREEAERLTEEAYNKVKEVKSKLERKDKLQKLLWKDYHNISENEYNALCEKHNIKLDPNNSKILKIKSPEDYDAYYKKIDDMRKKIQSGLAWKLLCKIEDHYYNLNREELLHESLDELKKRIKVIDANKVLPLIQQDGD